MEEMEERSEESKSDKTNCDKLLARSILTY